MVNFNEEEGRRMYGELKVLYSKIRTERNPMRNLEITEEAMTLLDRIEIIYPRDFINKLMTEDPL